MHQSSDKRSADMEKSSDNSSCPCHSDEGFLGTSYMDSDTDKSEVHLEPRSRTLEIPYFGHDFEHGHGLGHTCSPVSKSDDIVM